MCRAGTAACSNRRQGTVRVGEIAASARAEFAALGFGRPFTVDRLGALGAQPSG
jgi:hypothetical protein